MGHLEIFPITLVRFSLLYPKALDKNIIILKSVFSKRMAMVINYSQIEINCFVLFLDFLLLDMTNGINVCFWKASNDILHLTFPKEIKIFY